MSKLYTVDKYKDAVFSLAEHHNYTALEYEGDDEYTLIFRIFEKGNKIPIGMWPITLKDNVRDVKVIEYTEYLVFPAQNIPGSSQKEFDAIIEML
jgi:hypothetical protein